MIQLENQFTSGSGGYSSNPLFYKLIQRTNNNTNNSIHHIPNIAIYQRFYNNNKPLDYEIFIIKIVKKGTKLYQKIYQDDQEIYPGTNQFGHLAWSTNSLSRAITIYNNLLSKLSSNNPKLNPLDNISIPTNNFSTNDLKNLNSIPYVIANNFIKSNIKSGNIKFVKKERTSKRGKLTNIYSKS